MEQSHLLLGKWRRRIFGTLWLSYAFMYLGRVNMAIALPFIEQELGWTTVTLGLISGSFYWVYALGQLVNGALGDHLSPRWFVFVGLVGTAAMNLGFGFSETFIPMLLFWSLNGVFQSMGWGPILKTASNWTRPAERNKMSAFLGTTFVLGSLISWYLSGQILSRFDRWELVFWIPGIVLGLHSLLWVTLIRDHPRDVDLTLDESSSSTTEHKPALRIYIRETLIFLRQPKFLFLALITIIQGIIKDGISLWTPSLLVQSHNQSIGVAAIYALLIPTFGFLGVLLATWFNHKLRGNDELTITLLFVIGVAVALSARLVLTSGSVLALALLIGLCSLIINGINIVLLSSIPLRYSNSGKTSTLAGFLDFASYVGSGTMTILTGVVVSSWGWQALLWVWVALFVLGGVLMLTRVFSPDTKLAENPPML
ncbi:MAG: MFS transporter [Firmicutes bacterium]|nr:MFS transporter [Bacillota bacterium]